MLDPADVAFDEQGLVACVIQDWRSGEVLTLAYMNAEALRRTLQSGELHLYSRSREEQWHKGATSGHTQAVKALRLDCDGDAILALVSLGYKQIDAHRIVLAIADKAGPKATVEELVRAALKSA